MKETDDLTSKSKSFEWNLVGWFGASLGATAWMILTPFLLTWPPNGVVAGVVATLLIWSFSSIAWAMRRRISAFTGIVLLLCVTVLINLAFLVFAHLNALPLNEASQEIGANYGFYYTALVALFVSLLFFFWVKEMRDKKQG